MPRIADVAELIMGQSPPSSTYNQDANGLPFYQGKSDFGFRHPVPRSYCSAPTKRAEAGDILISVRAPVGPTNIAQSSCCIGRGVAAIRPKAVDGEFLFFNLRYVEPYVASLGSGTIFQSINKSQLGDVEVNQDGFSLPEQQKIAGVLGLVQRAMEQQERLIEKTAELKKTLLHQLFTQSTRGEPQKQTDLGPVPESWEVVELGKAANLFCGFAFKSTDAVPASNTQLVRMGNLYQNRLSLDRSALFYPDAFVDKYPRFVLRRGDLIMSLTGTSGKEDYGFTVELPDVSHALLLNQRVARVDLISDKLLRGFLFYFLLSRKFLDHLYPTAKGMKQANLSTNAMKKLLVAIPKKDEQQEIECCFRALDAKLAHHRRKHATLSALFRTLLHQLMTAQLRVHDLELDGILEQAVQETDAP